MENKPQRLRDSEKPIFYNERVIDRITASAIELGSIVNFYTLVLKGLFYKLSVSVSLCLYYPQKNRKKPRGLTT